MSVFFGKIVRLSNSLYFQPLYRRADNGRWHEIDWLEIKMPYQYHQAKDNIFLYVEDNRYLSEYQDYYGNEYRVIDFDENKDVEENRGSEGTFFPAEYKLLFEPSRFKSPSDYQLYPKLTITMPTENFVRMPDGIGDLVGDVLFEIEGFEEYVFGPYKIINRTRDNVKVASFKLKDNGYVIYGRRKPDWSKTAVYTDTGMKVFYPLSKDVNEDDEICLDVATDEMLLETYIKSAGNEIVVDGKISTENIKKYLKTEDTSLFVNSDIPADITEKRQTRFLDLFDKLTAFQETSEAGSGKLIQQIIDNPERLQKVKSYAFVTSMIDNKREELQSLEEQVKQLKQQIDSSKNEVESRQKEKLEQDNQELVNEIEDLKAKREEIVSQVEGFRKQHEKFTDLTELESELEYKQKRIDELNLKLATINKNIDSVFDNTTEKAMNIAFDGMLSSKMLAKAAEWEGTQRQNEYLDVVNYLKKEIVPLEDESEGEIVERLVNRVKLHRPNYNHNEIVNILICIAQGFITVFSGKPGTGKTSICKIVGKELGLRLPSARGLKNGDLNLDRFVNVSVEKGWTNKRDFIGYYNSLTRTFDRSNSQMYDGLKILDCEARLGEGNGVDMPFVILLDEANLSPMEYYWASFMNICDNLKDNDGIAFGEEVFKIPENLRFVATINNDHTTESLSPRLIDRSWIITLPDSFSPDVAVSVPDTDPEPTSWKVFYNTFGKGGSQLSSEGNLKQIFSSICQAFNDMDVNISNRSVSAIIPYINTASRLFVPDEDDASTIALDYAISQRMLTQINGSGKEYEDKLKVLNDLFTKNNLFKSETVLTGILERGKDLKYFKFFA